MEISPSQGPWADPREGIVPRRAVRRNGHCDKRKKLLASGEGRESEEKIHHEHKQTSWNTIPLVR